jgi:hypothetical protein
MMEGLRARAFRVYLQHALSSALSIDSVVRQRDALSQVERVDTGAALATWMRYCRNAQTFCGVYGLAAIDRAESRLLHCLQYECSFHLADCSTNEDLVRKYEKSALCYANAVVRQHVSDTFNAELWSYAGCMYDRADPSRLLISENCFEDEMPNTGEEELEWKALALKYETLTDKPSQAPTSDIIIALRRDIALHYRTAVAQSAVSLAQSAHEDEINYGFYYSDKAYAAAAFAEHLVCALDCTQKALQCDEAESDLQTLWTLCACYLRSAVTEKNVTRSAWWQARAKSLCSVAEKLAVVLRSVGSLSITAPAAEVSKVKQQLSQLFRRINESALVTGTVGIDSPRYSFSTIDIEELVCAISFTLQVLSPVESAEDKTRKRLLAAAGKVNVDQSPAHPHIKQCWLNAAEQMRLAIVARSELACAQHKKRCFQQERLVLGPLATATDYFAKANSSPLSSQGRSLWNDAARLQLDASISLTERSRQITEQAQARVEFDEQEWEKVQRARLLAEAADCCTRASTSRAAVLQSVELQLRLILVELGPTQYRDNNTLRIYLRLDCDDLFLFCRGQPAHALTLPAPPDEPVENDDGESDGAGSSDDEDDAPSSTEQRVDKAGWVCGVMMQLARLTAAAGASPAVKDAALSIRRVLSPCISEVISSEKTEVCPQSTARIDAAVEAFVQSQHQLTESARAGATVAEQDARKDSAQQFLTSANHITCGISCIQGEVTYSRDEATHHFERGERALQAARWYAAAAQAAAAEEWWVHRLFVKAAGYSGENAIDQHGKAVAGSDTRYVYSEELRPAATRAGERFARAAEALLAGDTELCELWLKAAQATAEAREDSEALAQAAQQLQDAVLAHKAAVAPAQATSGEGATASGPSGTPSAGGKRKREDEERG